MFWETLLASMVNMVGPGNSLYSTVNISYCDEACQAKVTCENQADWRCSKPKYSHKLHQQLIIKALKDPNNAGLQFTEVSAKTRPNAFKRYETKEEGLLRYVTIAKSIDKISAMYTRSICVNKCTDDDCIKKCKKNAPWAGDRRSLALMMTMIARYESGFRRDVHSGEAGGDCTWKKNGRVVSSKTKGAKPYACRSFCLGQINIGKGTIRINGNVWKKENLVGIDSASTNRCFQAVAKILARSRHYCNSSWSGPRQNDWAKATFSAYGSGHACRISAKKYEKKDGKTIALNGYLINGKVVWAPFRPLNANNRTPPIEAAWPGARSSKFWNHYKNQRILDPKLKQEIERLQGK